MKTIGLLGGMSWESSVEYYRIINEEVKRRLGGLHSARCLLWSFDFAEIEALQMAGDWDAAARRMVDAALSLERGGADGIVICTNTMHKVAPAIERAVRIPLLHIADPTAAAAKEAGLKTVGLLGTRFTMGDDFYRGRLAERHGLNVLVPDAADRATVHRVIYEELCQGQIRTDSRARYRRIIQNLVEAGAEGIVLGCTEISLLVGPADAAVPLFDTAALHARHAALWALAIGAENGDSLTEGQPASAGPAGEFADALRLRPATPDDLALLERWDEQPHVVASDPNDDWGWENELGRNPDWREQLIAEIAGRPIGYIEVIDPAREDGHYWGEVPAGLRAIDIWIGEEAELGKGHGTRMMRLALDRCFADPAVSAVLVDPLATNTRAHRFYERLGFRFVEPRRFGLDDCFVYRLDRADYTPAAR